MHTCVCHVCNQSLTKISLHSSLHASLPAYLHSHLRSDCYNFDTFYPTKWKFGMIFTQTKTLDFMVELLLGGARGQNVEQVILNTCKMAIES